MPSACDNVKGLADTPTLFGVDGLVAVVTGGGTGTSIRSRKHSFDPTLLRVVFARCARHSPFTHLRRHRADDREGPGAQRRGGVHRRPAAAGARRSRARAQCACIIVSDSCHHAVRCRKSAPGLISLVRSRSVGAASFPSRATSPRANPCRRSRRRSARSTAS